MRVTEGLHDGVEARPTFRLGQYYLSLGDTVIGYHRLRKINVEGTVIVLAGCLCISTMEGIFPIQRIAIQTVQPPMFEAAPSLP